jgi:hypothetical protein
LFIRFRPDNKEALAKALGCRSSAQPPKNTWGKELNIGNVSEFAFDKYGRWLAVAVDAQGQAGNGI